VVQKTKNFDLPIRKKRDGTYKIAAGTEVMTCFTSDFFVEDADIWRDEVWEMIRERSDLSFMFITKRIHRLEECLPADWGEGYDHVTICCTMENQQQVDFRMPIYKAAPIKHKILICEPLLSRLDLTPWVGNWLEQVVVGGESGREARICDYEWVKEIHDLCVERKVAFWFKQTGANFRKEGNLYKIARQLQHSQARKAGINFKP